MPDLTAEIVRDNTRASVFYTARCRKCGESPDGDGEEFNGTEEEALSWALLNAEWWLSPDGHAFCDCCRPDESRAGDNERSAG